MSISFYEEVKKNVRECVRQFKSRRIKHQVQRSNHVKKRKKENTKKNKLIAEAKKGNVEAIENLTISDIDNYARVTMRIKNEDLLSIVDTSITPSGSESEMYNIMGNILSVSPETNSQTGEKLWVMQVECNEIIIDVSINEADLMGVPEAGRRFRGNVWLQGCLSEE